MYWQQRYLKDTKQFESATTGLETIDLPKTGLLSGLELRVWGTNGNSAGDPDIWLHDRLKKVEVIVNGSKVVKSLEGTQLLADMLYKKTPLYSHDMKNMNNASAEEFFYINMGRFYHDLDYMLDLSKVSDPELRLEYDFSMASANGWSNGVAMAAAPYFSLIPHILREPAAEPKGYIKTSEVYRFTSGASKKENMLLPLGPVYAMLYLQIWYASHGLTADLDKVELNINSDDIIPFRVGVTELLSELVRKYGLFEFSQQTTLKGGQAYPFPLEVGRAVGYPNPNADIEFRGQDYWSAANVAPLRATSTGSASTSNFNMNFTMLGCLPFGIAAIPVFDLEDERLWIKSAELGDLWLRVEESSSAASSVPKLLADEIVTSY